MGSECPSGKYTGNDSQGVGSRDSQPRTHWMNQSNMLVDAGTEPGMAGLVG